MSEPVRLFVGCSANGEDAESQMVLEYTARQNCSRELEITWMRASHDPESIWGRWDMTHWATPFSGFRWAIPEACEFEGRAIYMDSDMIVMGDLAELIDEPMNDGQIVAAKGGWRFCVAVWDCQRADAYLPAVESMKADSMAHQRCFNWLASKPHLVKTFDRQWNNFDGENDPIEIDVSEFSTNIETPIRILHYTDMSTQPHLKYAIPRLERAGLSHWYDGEIRAHRRKDVELLFDHYYRKAMASELYGLGGYIPNELYGPYDKESQANYRAGNGFDVTRGE